MNKDRIDSQLLFLVAEYIGKFNQVPPIFSDALAESRIKEALAHAITANEPIESIPEN